MQPVLAVPTRREAFTVFAQQAAPALESEALTTRAARFFDARLEVFGQPGDATPEMIVARVVANGNARTCFGRLRTDHDLAIAEAAESRGGYTGMSLLAARCKSVWLVQIVSADDCAALLIAAILASVLLGPILSPDTEDLFGVKTARAKLAR